MEERKKVFIIIGAIIAGLFYFISQSDFEVFAQSNNGVEETSEKFMLDAGDQTILVQVSGDVDRPHIYRVKDDMILRDLLQLAGLRHTSDTAGLNLVDIVVANAHYKITSVFDDDSSIATFPGSQGQGDNQNQSNLININTATKAQLMTLKGIGEATATRIINYRRDDIFYSIEDIKNVSGIGETIFANIKNHIIV